MTSNDVTVIPTDDELVVIIKTDGGWRVAHVGTANYHNLMNGQPQPGFATPEAALEHEAKLAEEEHWAEVDRSNAPYVSAQEERYEALAEAEELLASRKAELEKLEGMRRELMTTPDTSLREKKLELLDAEMGNYRHDIDYLWTVCRDIKWEIWSS